MTELEHAWNNHWKHVPDTYCRPLAATCNKKNEHAYHITADDLVYPY